MKRQFKVRTYNGANGHGDPTHKILVEDGQGLTITLPEDEAGFRPDIYIERVEGKWTINVSPEESDIRAVVEISAGGTLSVRDARGHQLFEEARPV